MTKPFDWVTDLSLKFLSKDYLSPGETVESRVADIANKAEQYLNIPGFSEKFYDYMSKGYFSLSSPVWSNYGKDRGLPVSCFSSTTSDSVAGILESTSEIGMMSKLGGGTAIHLGYLRPSGSPITDNGFSTGPVSFMPMYEAVTNSISQGAVRRGRTAAYLPIDHPDFAEFVLTATDGNPVQDLLTAAVIPKNWMQSMLDGDPDKRKLWSQLLTVRKNIGFPYIVFQDNANDQAPDVYRDKNLPIIQSNLCSEIFLNTDPDHSLVCVLSSMNLVHYDEWKNTDAVETLTFFLDTVVTDFLNKLEAYRDSSEKDHQQTFTFMQRAYNFAKRERALGMGTLGWHSLLQSKLIAFESRNAAQLNLEIAKHLNQKTLEASKKLASLYGEPSLLKGYGRRNSTLMAIAPTTSSAFILGQASQSIEPYFSNYYVKDIAKIKTAIKNPYLEKVLENAGHNTPEVWEIIKKADGSVYGLPDEILSPELKEVFKTFREINQESVIDQAAARQPYIDQGQSLNLMIDSSMTPKEIHELHVRAWKLGLKSLYYQHSVNQAQEFTRSKSNECTACHA